MKDPAPKKWPDNMKSCFNSESASFAIGFSAFGGIRPTESELPFMEASFKKMEGSIGLPENVAVLFLKETADSKVLLAYNANAYEVKMRIFNNFFESNIQNVNLVGRPTYEQKNAIVSNGYAEITIPAHHLYEIELNLDEKEEPVSDSCNDENCDPDYDCYKCDDYGDCNDWECETRNHKNNKPF